MELCSNHNFDIVTIKPRVSTPRGKAAQGALDDDSKSPAFLVAAVNDWTIIPKIEVIY